jgi:acetyl esterase
MPLSPDVQDFLTQLDALGAPRYGEQPPEVARQVMEEGAPALFGPFEPVPFEDRTIPGPGGPIPIRTYRPENPTGALVYFHGGGWVLGNIRTVDGVCATLARRAGITVISVDYRLAPEHRFPAAVDDAWAATTWAYANREQLGATGRLAVGGDSSGGNLAAVAARRAGDKGMALALQLLVYPVTDADLDTVSYRDNANGYWLTRDGMVWFWDLYVPDGDRFHPDASPLRAGDLGGVAPALVITAEFDPLRDEGEAYATRLEQAGVPVTLKRYDGLVHGFFRCAAVLAASDEALGLASATLADAMTRA